jgi:hypothetical protein
MQSAAKHLAWRSILTLLITAPREMLRCALHDKRLLNTLAKIVSIASFMAIMVLQRSFAE